MKRIIITLCLFGLTMPVFAQTSTNSQVAYQPHPADLPVNGAIVSVNPYNKNLTVLDNIHGGNRTFYVDTPDVLRGLTTGDQVSIVPEKEDSSKAFSVAKI